MDLKIIVAGHVVLAVDLLGDNIVDLGEVGVDDDHAVTAVNLIELDLLALSAEGVLGLGSGQSIGVLGQLAVVIDLNDLVGLLDAESLQMSHSVVATWKAASGVATMVAYSVVSSHRIGVGVSVLGPDGGRTALNRQCRRRRRA